MTEKEKLLDLLSVVESELKRSLESLGNDTVTDEIFSNRAYIFLVLDNWNKRELMIRAAFQTLEKQAIELP